MQPYHDAIFKVSSDNALKWSRSFNRNLDLRGQKHFQQRKCVKWIESFFYSNEIELRGKSNDYGFSIPESA